MGFQIAQYPVMSYVSFKCRAGHVYFWESEFALVVVFVLSECLIKLRQS